MQVENEKRQDQDSYQTKINFFGIATSGFNIHGKQLRALTPIFKIYKRVKNKTYFSRVYLIAGYT